MAKTVFRPNEIRNSSDEMVLKLVHDYGPVVEDVPEIVEEVYAGPTADDLRREAELFKKNWELEKEQMLAQAQSTADDIVKKAEDASFAEVKRQSDQAAVIKADAQRAADEVLATAQENAEKILASARAEETRIKEAARTEGYNEGHEEGYRIGNAEAERLVERLHKMLEAVMDRREEILRETETQIVQLIILMTRKVVKIISENQKSVIMSNVLAALKKVKGRGNVLLRVNLEDVKLTTEHIDEFIKRVESVQSITVAKDSSVERGGCIVETDFGAIDARISSQLNELEQKILEVSPVRTLAKSDSITSDV